MSGYSASIAARNCSKRAKNSREVLLVADPEMGEPEGLAMAHLRAHLAPGRVRRAVGELDQVEGVLDVALQQFLVVGGPVLAASGDQGGHCMVSGIAPTSSAKRKYS
ncbi:hypothetical protein SHIRM173S_10754 [Streptomyces hirsutus]